MKNTEGETFFWNFLRKYFENNDIRRHPPFEISVGNEKKSVQPEFIVDTDSKIIFEFKELKESEVPNSHRDRLIKTHRLIGTHAIPNIGHRLIEKAMLKGELQLRPCIDIGCPGVIVIYSAIHELRLHLNRHDRYTSCMYIPGKFQQKKTPMNKYPHISALAYFSVDDDDPNSILYRIRFYHNKFAEYKLPIDPFVDSKCQHYTINNDLLWSRVLDHDEALGI